MFLQGICQHCAPNVQGFLLISPLHHDAKQKGTAFGPTSAPKKKAQITAFGFPGSPGAEELARSSGEIEPGSSTGAAS